MEVTIEELPSLSKLYRSFSIFIPERSWKILAILTASDVVVGRWTTKLLRDYEKQVTRVIIGFDLGRDPDKSAGVLKLSVGKQCLIFQLAQAKTFSPSLHSFLSDPRLRFAGVNAELNALHLSTHYRLDIANIICLNDLATEAFNNCNLERASLLSLAKLIVKISVNEPKSPGLPPWDSEVLSLEQIKQATIDAILCFMMASRLIHRRSIDHFMPYSMETNIEELKSTSSLCKVYAVTIPSRNHSLCTTVTRYGSIVRQWLEDVLKQCRKNVPKVVVGFDLGQNLNKPAGILKLCVQNQCLIYQLAQADDFPPALKNFFSNKKLKFVGVGVDSNTKITLKDISLKVENAIDLRKLAKEKLNKDFEHMNIMALSREIINTWVIRPREIILLSWDSEELTFEQIKHATLDAFFCFLVGLQLILNE